MTESIKETCVLKKVKCKRVTEGRQLLMELEAGDETMRKEGGKEGGKRVRSHCALVEMPTSAAPPGGLVLLLTTPGRRCSRMFIPVHTARSYY